MITRKKIKARRKFRTLHHIYNKNWVYQYSFRILDFDEAREVLNIINLKMGSWQVGKNVNNDFLTFGFRSKLNLKAVYSLLPEKFHTSLSQDF